MGRHRLLEAGMALCLVVVIMCGMTGTASPEPTRHVVKLGTVGAFAATYYAPLIVAIRKGFFQQQGVQLEIIQIGPDDNLVRAVAAGALGLGIPEVSIAINGNAHGAPVSVIAGLTDRYPYDLVAKPTVKSYADLRGKTLAHWTVAPEASLALIRGLMAANGLKEGDYNVIAGGNQPTRYAALGRGGVDAAILTVPYNVLARRNGFTILGGLYDIPAVFAGLIANKGWAAKNEDAIVAWLKAAILGFRYVANPANKDEVVKMLAEETKLDPGVVEPTYEQLYRTQTYLVSWDLSPSLRSMQGVVDILAGIGQIPKPATPLTYFELKYLNRALGELRR
jgi:ABC-type nitrate/sulfonate/bicarbonate transport system substrate-binding protein